MGDLIPPAISPENPLFQRQLATAQGIHRSTLGHRLRGRCNRSQGHAGQSALLQEEEITVAVALEQLCNWHWAPSRAHMRSLAEDLLRARTGNFRANLGNRWPDCFVARHPTFRTTWSELLSSVRAAADLPEILVRWAEKL